ncbi:MAG: DUF4157 domain-containing protein [Micropruina sp.]|uniref:eCIS core domain-containing protein n=1 Tax=Micropruina sp. TaxID=2737536 RepID=UPI0039E47C19
MHDHLSDERIATLRPKGSRIDGDAEAMAGKAAGRGRTDVLDPDAILGLQRSAGNGAVAQLMEEERSPVHDVISSGGRPIEPDVREDMEARLGHDFSDVRIHDDAAAADSAKAVNAHAYTVGSNVVFQRNVYDPSSTAGKTTLAHELTHVIQQRNGPVEGTSAPGGIKVSDPSDRFEREASANADRVMAGPAPVQTLSGSAPAVQREEAEEEELQGLFVQREEEKKDEEEPVQGLFLQRAEDEEVEETPV